MSDLLARLKQAAENATPGPWEGWQPSAALKLRDIRTVERYDEGPTFGAVALYAKPADAEFIALADPPTVLTLVELAKAAKEHYDAWNGDAGGYEEGQRIVATREALEAALARLFAANEKGAFSVEQDVLVPLQEVEVGRGWRIHGDAAYNEPNTYVDVESDLMEDAKNRNGRSIFLLTANSDLWADDPKLIGLSLEGAVALIVALEREIGFDPVDQQTAELLKAQLEARLNAANDPDTEHQPRKGTR